MSALVLELQLKPYQLSEQGSWKYLSKASWPLFSLGMVVKFQVELNRGLERQSKPVHRSSNAPISKACSEVGMLVGILVGGIVG